MTEEDGIYEYENGFDFYKDNADNKIWSVETDETIDSIGEMLFSFDKKNIFNFWTDYPEKLTPEQIKIFKNEYPELARLKPTSDD